MGEPSSLQGPTRRVKLLRLLNIFVAFNSVYELALHFHLNTSLS